MRQTTRKHLQYSFWKEHPSIIRGGLSLIFIFTTMTIGILIICFTVPKKINKPCQINFAKTMYKNIGFDSRPRDVAVGDLNNDTYLDIVVANSGADNIGVFIAYPNRTFTNQTTYSTGFGSRPYSLAIGDFNNDTQLDIIVANYGTNSIGLLCANDNKTFTDPITISLGSSRPLSLTVVDFNNDEQLDIAVVNYGTSSISILLGFNNGSFRIESTFFMGYDSIPYSLAFGYFNTDKQLDIAIVNYGTNILTVFSSNENDNFTSHIYTTGKDSHPCSVVVGDYNHDHILDIAVANSATSNIGIFLGYGNGTFAKMNIQLLDDNSHPYFLITNDFTNDSKLDIITIDSENDNIVVLEGDGKGNFSMVVQHSTGYNSNPTSIGMGDFDNDNIPDITITNNATNNIHVLTGYAVYLAANRSIYQMNNNGIGSFVVVGDFNNDNCSDIVIADTGTNRIVIFTGLGDGTFKRKIGFSRKGMIPSMLVINDINKDNQLDLIIPLYWEQSVLIVFGRGDGTFRDGGTYSTGDGSFPQWIAVGDLNNDTYLDIVIASSGNDAGSYPGSLGVILGKKDGSFRKVTIYLNGTMFYWTFVGLSDFNNDNILDIVATDSSFGNIAILLGSGNGSFNILSVESINDRPNTLAMNDLNNDQQIDIVYDSAYLNSIGILLGNGDGTFRNVTRYYTGHGTWPWSITLANFNNDTILDIAITDINRNNIFIFMGYGNGSFASPTRFSTESMYQSKYIACSDFNNDTQIDIVAVDYDSNVINVFLFRYETDFTSDTIYFTGSGPHPYSVAVGNFTKDNHYEIIVANSGNDNIEVLFNYNNEVFMNRTAYSTGFGSYPQSVIVADFNRDSHQDVAVVNSRLGSVNVFLGNYNGTFDTSSIHLIGLDSFPSSIAADDFNQDNWTDIVVANTGTNDIAVFLGFGYTKFTNQTILISGPTSSPTGIAVGDFNNDYYQDMVVVSFVRKMLYIYFGYGNGLFTNETFLPSGIYRLMSINVIDIDGDKILDLVVTSEAEDTAQEQYIGVFLGYGNGSFSPQIINPTNKASGAGTLALGDFTNDNILDIIFINVYTDSFDIYIGYGNGTFIAYKKYRTGTGSSPTSVVVNDLNYDNILDIVVANSGTNNIGLFLGYGNGTFTNMIKLLTEGNSGPYSVAMGHLNNDTWIDIAVAHGYDNIGIFFGYGNGSFSLEKMYSVGSQSDLYFITIADLNNDTNFDIIYSDYGYSNGNIGIFYGYGDGTFATLKTYSTGFQTDPYAISICDFNNDSLPDLSILYTSIDSIGIMIQYATDPFTTPLLLSTANDSQPKSVATGDFNNDNKLDIVVANFGTNNIGIFLGNGNGTFDTQQTYSYTNNSRPISIAVGDFNNDHYLDIVIADSETNNIIIFRGYGNGTVDVLKAYSTGESSIPSSLAVKDLNKDDLLDIVVTNFNSNDVLVFLASSNGSFQILNSYSLGYNSRPQSVTIGDIDNDHLLDIIVAEYGADHVAVLLQTC